tara:strand:- start:1922 stop:2203 length:282 start_codon:yes stop_codon:yes gene_type:complete
MECVVEYNGNEYRFCRNEKGRPYWVGHKRGSGGGNFVGLNCVAPLYIYSNLVKEAISSGDFEKDFFFSKKIEKKTSKPRKARVRKNSNSISIF